MIYSIKAYKTKKIIYSHKTRLANQNSSTQAAVFKTPEFCSKGSCLNATFKPTTIC